MGVLRSSTTCDIDSTKRVDRFQLSAWVIQITGTPTA